MDYELNVQITIFSLVSIQSNLHGCECLGNLGGCHWQYVSKTIVFKLFVHTLSSSGMQFK
jgi:hypothetical protein